MLHATRRLQELHKQLGHSDVTASGTQPKLRLAFIGCGQICHAHLNGLNALAADHVRVTVCIDPSARAKEVADLVGQTEAGDGSIPRTFVRNQK